MELCEAGEVIWIKLPAKVQKKNSHKNNRKDKKIKYDTQFKLYTGKI